MWLKMEGIKKMRKFYCLTILTLINCISTDYSLVLENTGDKAEIKRMQEVQRKAHFSHDAGLLVSMFSQDFTNVSGGKIERLTQEQGYNRFQPYFDQSTFMEWDNLAEPITRVSKDGTMAYSIVHKRVGLKAKDENGVERQHLTTYAWIETYEKQKGKWKLTAVASTNEPPQQK